MFLKEAEIANELEGVGLEGHCTDQCNDALISAMRGWQVVLV